MLGTSGNLSLRLSETPLEYLITASGKDKGALNPETDFVRVGIGGRVIAPEDATSSAETLLHEGIYQQFPPIQAVYHVHTGSAAVLSRHGLDENSCLTFSNLEMLKGLGFETHQHSVSLPVIENSQDMVALSQTLPARLSANVPGFILKEHGLYTWGNTPFEAKRHVEIWEYLFQFRLAEMAVVSTPPISTRT